jgi:hypothetical protein
MCPKVIRLGILCRATRPGFCQFLKGSKGFWLGKWVELMCVVFVRGNWPLVVPDSVRRWFTWQVQNPPNPGRISNQGLVPWCKR